MLCYSLYARSSPFHIGGMGMTHYKEKDNNPYLNRTFLTFVFLAAFIPILCIALCLCVAPSTDADLHFKLILLTIVCLTVLFAVEYMVLCLYVIIPTNMQEECAQTLKTLIVLGFGTICGLLGGRTI